MRDLRNILIIIVGLGIPLFIPDIHFRINILFISLGLAAVVGILAFSFRFAHNVYVRETASALMLMNAAALAITAFGMTPVNVALLVGMLGALFMGFGYIGLRMARKIPA